MTAIDNQSNPMQFQRFLIIYADGSQAYREAENLQKLAEGDSRRDDIQSITRLPNFLFRDND